MRGEIICCKQPFFFKALGILDGHFFSTASAQERVRASSQMNDLGIYKCIHDKNECVVKVIFSTGA
jgi:hypothetical protein